MHGTLACHALATCEPWSEEVRSSQSKELPKEHCLLGVKGVSGVGGERADFGVMGMWIDCATLLAEWLPNGCNGTTPVFVCDIGCV